jgi:hypothetical protein
MKGIQTKRQKRFGDGWLSFGETDTFVVMDDENILLV